VENFLASSTKVYNIPLDIRRKIIGYMGDEDLFQARSVNRLFYCGFYEQRVTEKDARKFNFFRALRLAERKGRVFKNAEYFFVQHFGYNSVTDSFLNQLHFPALNFLDVRLEKLGHVHDLADVHKSEDEDNLEDYIDFE